MHLSANQDMISSTYHLDDDEHLSLFNATCSNILNSVTPLKVKKHKIQYLGKMTLLVLSDRPVEGINVNGNMINYKCHMKF